MILSNFDRSMFIFMCRGGYITDEYGSSQGGVVDAIQIEVPGEIRFRTLFRNIVLLDEIYINNIFE